jgi:DNA polymerase III epsilon subunit-like protein
MMNYVSLDLETTGLDPLACDVIEFAAVLDDLSAAKELPVDRLPFFHCYFYKDSYVGEPAALAMHASIFDRIARRGEEDYRKKYSYFSAEHFGKSFKQFLLNNGYTTEYDKVIINAAGKNFSSFDLQFLKYKTDFCKHIHVRSCVLDPGILFVKNSDKSIPGLAECKTRAGLDGYVCHNALADARDTILVLRKGINKIYGKI